MGLKTLFLSNFKAFGRPQEIPFRPLTLVYGPNSGGKSSLLHSLLLIDHLVHHGRTTPSPAWDIHATRAGQASVDLGGFRQYIHRKDRKERVCLGVEFPVSSFQHLALFSGIFRSHQTLTIQVEAGEIDEESPFSSADLFSVEVFADEERVFHLPRSKAGQLSVASVSMELFWPLLRDKFRKEADLATAEIGDLEASTGEWLDQLFYEAGGFFPSLRTIRPSFEETPKVPYPETFQEFRTFFEGALEQIRMLLQHTLRLLYLGPLRSYPPRYAFAHAQDPNLIAGGMLAWQYLSDRPDVRAKINAWLGAPDRLKTPYELRVGELIATKGGSEGSPPNTEKIGPFPYLLDLRSNTEVSHRDIGVGVSQVLPVLVYTMMAQPDSLVLMEQPEIHLHPRLQADLADEFIQAALAGNRSTFCIETHSENLLLRIMRRMRQTVQGKLPKGMPPVTPNDVSLLYVEPLEDGSGAGVREIPLSPDGKLVEPWPDGFFEEGFHERFDD